MAEIQLQEVTKTFSRGGDETVALEALSLVVPDGTFVTVLGPSGCGKTTALNLIAGFEQPTSGQVRVGGVPVLRPGPDRAVVFQEASLFPWLTVEQNVAFGLELAGMPRPRIEQRTTKMLEAVGLSHFRRRLPAELSGGMRQRVAIARVLALGSNVLLMDEPFGALDAQTRGLMQEFLVSLWEQQRKTVFFITHDIAEAIFLADQVVVMTARPGRIKEVIQVDLPRPRDFALQTSDRFHQLRDRALALVREEALKVVREQERAA